jgi:hypothetical protein
MLLCRGGLKDVVTLGRVGPAILWRSSYSLQGNIYVQILFEQRYLGRMLRVLKFWSFDVRARDDLQKEKKEPKRYPCFLSLRD